MMEIKFDYTIEELTFYNTFDEEAMSSASFNCNSEFEMFARLGLSIAKARTSAVCAVHVVMKKLNKTKLWMIQCLQLGLSLLSEKIIIICVFGNFGTNPACLPNPSIKTTNSIQLKTIEKC